MTFKQDSVRSPRYLLAALALLLAAPAAASSRVERELALASGGLLRVDADAGHVTVTGVERDGARVVVTWSRDDLEDRFDLRFAERDGEVEIVAERRGSRAFGWFGRSESLHFEIEVPIATELDLDTAGGAIEVSTIRGDVSVRTSGGAVRLRDVEGERIEARTSGGSMEARSLRGKTLLETSGGAIDAEEIDGDLVADTSGGSIEVESVSGDVTADTSGGSISLREVGGAVKAHSSGGPVTAYLTSGNDAGGSLTSSGGRVTVYVDPSVSLELDASSSGGGVTIDLPITVEGRLSRTAIRGELNGGGELLQLRSSGGGVRVRPI